LMIMPVQALAADCVNATLRDANGLSIKTDQPLIAMMIPDVGPIVNQTLPAATRLEPGLPTPCTPDLIAAVRGVFNESCLSDATRSAAAQANGVAIDVVNKRCQALYRAVEINR